MIYKQIAIRVMLISLMKDTQLNHNLLKVQKLFDYVYCCRMGNGAYTTKDESDYFGVGFIHLTGKNMYKSIHNI